jgi:hypothetical protein
MLRHSVLLQPTSSHTPRGGRMTAAMNLQHIGTADGAWQRVNDLDVDATQQRGGRRLHVSSCSAHTCRDQAHCAHVPGTASASAALCAGTLCAGCCGRPQCACAAVCRGRCKQSQLTVCAARSTRTHAALCARIQHCTHALADVGAREGHGGRTDSRFGALGGVGAECSSGCGIARGAAVMSHEGHSGATC